MGTIQSVSILTEELLDEYSILTYLSKSEILHLCKTLGTLHPTGIEQDNSRYSIDVIEKVFPQLKYNPFKDRILRVFSSVKDDHFSFEDMLDLCSVMSEKCPAKVKAEWAFRIYDFDEDGEIGENDLQELIQRLQCEIKINGLSEDERQRLIKILLKEMDLEANGSIGRLEFVHSIGKMTVFPQTFCFTL